jgi:hypothetical protein
MLFFNAVCRLPGTLRKIPVAAEIDAASAVSEDRSTAGATRSLAAELASLVFAA